MSFTYPLHDMLPNVIQNILRANIHLSIPFFWRAATAGFYFPQIMFIAGRCIIGTED